MSAVQKRIHEQTIRASRRWHADADQRDAIAEKMKAGGTAAAETTQRVAQHKLREATRLTVPMRPLRAAVAAAVDLRERTIGPTLDLDDVAPDDTAYQAGLPVARVVELAASGFEPTGFGSGFLVAPGLFLTNNHVLPDADSAANAGVNFRFEKLAQGLRKGEIFDLDPSTFFLTNEELDFTLVAVNPKQNDGRGLDAYGLTPLIEATGKILLGQKIQIIQHPAGGPKKYAVRDNHLADILDLFLHYTTDTLRGSSGSPAFNMHWEVVALHHSGVGPLNANGDVVTKNGRVYDPETMSDSEVEWVANEGVRASVIVASLRQALPGLPPAKARLLQAVLTEALDPLEVAGPKPILISTNPGGILNPMSQNVFNFTGPVTIHIGSTAPAVTPLPPDRKTEQPGGDGDTQEAISINPDYTTRGGYKRRFLGRDLDLPTVEGAGLAAKASQELKYEHFSIVMRKDRRLAFFTAVNIDGATAKRPTRDTDKWIFDPRLPKEFQLGEFLYKNNPLDRGHLVRRLDPAWGATRVAKIGNDDTFHFTNCSPQHSRLNQAIWNDLEDYLLDNADQDNVKLTIFTGPVFKDNDPIYREVKLPRQFWKVAVMTRQNGSEFLAAGFVQSQAQLIQGLREADFLAQEVRTDQVKVSDIEDLTGLNFRLPTSADPLEDSGTDESLRGLAVRKLSRLEDIRLK